jgi:phage I-like protein
MVENLMEGRGKLLPLDDLLTIALITITLGTIIACAAIVYFMRKKMGGERRELLTEKETLEKRPLLPFKVVRTVSQEEAAKAKEELRILDLEREILSDALRKLYEAHAEGKITEEERDRLAQTYKERMMTIKEAIARDESIVALHELEAMQEDLIKLFSERFDEISAKIEELRAKVEAKPIKEVTIQAERPPRKPEAGEKPEAEEKAKKKRKPSPRLPPRSEAEKRIEEIRAEVEKVLERLGQMEIET